MPLSSAVKEIHPRTVAVRRDLHQHPELAYQEVRTARLVAERLRALGIEVRTGVAETGVVGLLRGDHSGPTIMLRADMDALPVAEANDVPYKSQCEGIMHACGHDGHTAILLSAAEILCQRRGELHGNVKFCFQPAEEGGAGARRMVEEGVLEDPIVDLPIGLHLWNDLPCGVIGVRPGPVLASASHFDAWIRGNGTHAATPHQGTDAIVAAAQLVTAWQTIVSRNVKPIDPAVITVASLHAGTTYNIIPEEVAMQGTVRAFSDEVEQLLKSRMTVVLEATAAAYGMQGELRWGDGYPATVNDASACDLVRRVAAAVVGAESVVEPEPSLGAEDMSFYLRQRPGCYCMLGSSNRDKGLTAAHHNPRFDFDEESLAIGVEMMAGIATSYLAAAEKGEHE